MTMGRGYFLVRGDKTTCGGKIIEGADDHTIMGIPQARDMDRVTCGRYPGMFIIVGGVPETDIHGRLMAGTLDS
ncbi:PAAR domain-containing protein, partial [Escherichia coli]|nr:PAAR domain-containing protein [Escherichia coli]